MPSFGVGLGLFGQASTERQLRNVYGKLKNCETMVKRAIVRAVNRTAKKTERYIVDEIAAKVAIKKKDLRPYIKFTKRAATKSQYAEVTISKQDRIQLIYFGAKQTKKGVTYRIEKKGKRKLIRSAFITTAKGHRFVTKRVGKARHPIYAPMRGPSPWGVFVVGGMKKQTKREVRVILKKELKEEVRTGILRINKIIPDLYK